MRSESFGIVELEEPFVVQTKTTSREAWNHVIMTSTPARSHTRTPNGGTGATGILRLALMAATMMAMAGCRESPRTTSEWAVPDSLAPTHRVPKVAGRAVCTLDSVSTSLSSYQIFNCDLGSGTTFRVNSDTIFAFTRERRDTVSDSTIALLDYWNSSVRPEFEALTGRAPDHLGGSPGQNRDYLEAGWQEPTGIRRLVSLTRGVGPTVVVKQVVIDCRIIAGRSPALACM